MKRFKTNLKHIFPIFIMSMMLVSFVIGLIRINQTVYFWGLGWMDFTLANSFYIICWILLLNFIVKQNDKTDRNGL